MQLKDITNAGLEGKPSTTGGHGVRGPSPQPLDDLGKFRGK